MMSFVHKPILYYSYLFLICILFCSEYWSNLKDLLTTYS